MKRTIITILIPVAVLVICYAGCSFVLWNANPSKWGDGARFCTVFIGVLMGIAFAGMYNDLSKDN